MAILLPQVTRREVRLARPLSPFARPGRLLAGLLLVAATVIVALENATYRAFEAQLAALTLAPFADRVGFSGTTFYMQQPGGLLGLEITAECTALILIAPLMLLAAVILVLSRAAWWRVFTGTAAMWLLVTAVNEARLAFIGFASTTWGVDVGYPISHTYIGSVIGIAGFVAGLAALLLIAGSVRRHPATS